MIDKDNLSNAARSRRDRMVFPWAFEQAGLSFAEWHSRTFDRVSATLELTDLATPDATVLDESDFGSHWGQRLSLGLVDDERTEALFLAPAADGPFPAVLLFHDHGSEFRIGKEKMIAPWSDPASLALHHDWIARFYGGRSLGFELVRRGFAVLCADAIGWGSRIGNGYEAQQALAANLMQTGSSLAAVVAREDVQAARFLSANPLVDASRIAALGFSFGGFRAWQATALCSAISAVVAANWMGSVTRLIQPGNNLLRGQSAFYMLHPQLAGKLDFPDLAALIAPRPALFVAGRQDRHFPPPAVTPAFESLAHTWSAAGARSLIRRGWHDEGHLFNAAQQDFALDWLDTILNSR